MTAQSIPSMAVAASVASLGVELPDQVQKDLVRDVRERCSRASDRRKLRDQHRRLLDDRVDEKRDVHRALRRYACGEPGGERQKRRPPLFPTL